MKPCLRLLFLIAVGLFLFQPAIDAQQQFVPVSVTELCGMSDVIVDATVTRVRPARTNAAKKLETPVDMAVATVLKGPVALRHLELIEPGGKLRGQQEVYFGQLIPGAGERYILFLQRSGTGAYKALGGLHGHYRIINGRIQVHPAMPRILRTGFQNAPIEKLLKEIRVELGHQ